MDNAIFIIAICVLVFTIIGHFGLPFGTKVSIREIDYDSLSQDKQPFFKIQENKEIAVILIHGYAGTPLTMSFLAEELFENGASVFAPLLPGHGEDAEAFSKTRYEHWEKKVKQVFDEIRPLYKKVFLVGFSMGGNLCLKVIEELPTYRQPNGVITISAPMILNGFANGRIFYKDWKLTLSGLIQYVIKFIPKVKESKFSLRLSPWNGYGKHHPLAALHSLKINIRKTRRSLSKIKVPLCIIQIQNDKTVEPENAHFIARKVNSIEKRVFIFPLRENFTSRHRSITHLYSRDRVAHYIKRFIDDVCKQFDAYEMKSASWKSEKNKDEET